MSRVEYEFLVGYCVASRRHAQIPVLEEGARGRRTRLERVAVYRYLSSQQQQSECDCGMAWSWLLLGHMAVWNRCPNPNRPFPHFGASLLALATRGPPPALTAVLLLLLLEYVVALKESYHLSIEECNPSREAAAGGGSRRTCCIP